MYFLVFSLFLVFASEPNVPFLSGPLVDEVGLLDEKEAARVLESLHRINNSERVQMAVLISRSLEGNDIASYSIEVAEKWKLGTAKKDNGLILVVAPHERKMRLEVGYGLEGDLTDAESRRILDNYLRPLFRERRFGEGISAAIALADREINTSKTEYESLPKVSKNIGGSLVFPLLFLGMFFVSVIFSRRHRRRFGGTWWDSTGISHHGGSGGKWSGGFGGGGFSGGGGGFGGGGSSSSW